MIKFPEKSSDNFLFDRRILRDRRARSANINWPKNRFLFDEVSDRLAERLLDVSRKFELALDLGCHSGSFGKLIKQQGSISSLISADLSPALMGEIGSGAKVVADEEFLPFAPQSFDLVGHVLGLHWTNDLPGALVQIARMLKPDGLFLGAMYGIETLSELKWCLTQAEIEVKGGVSPRVSPYTEVRDAGALLQRAGFALPVGDVDVLTLKYKNAFALMHELRGMGEANALVDRQKTFTGRKILFRAAEIYQEEYADEDGLIPATFQVIYLGGWAPHENQQVALKPGSGQTNLKEILSKD